MLKNFLPLVAIIYLLSDVSFAKPRISDDELVRIISVRDGVIASMETDVERIRNIEKKKGVTEGAVFKIYDESYKKVKMELEYYNAQNEDQMYNYGTRKYKEFQTLVKQKRDKLRSNLTASRK